MAVDQTTLAERVGIYDSGGSPNFPTVEGKEPSQAIVTGWITNTIPRTISEYDVTSSDELILDLSEDLYNIYKWRKNTKGGTTINSQSGSMSYTRPPQYPSERSIIKHNLVKPSANTVKWLDGCGGVQGAID